VKAKKQPMSMLQLQQMFPDNDAAETWFIERRWGKTITCPFCTSTRVSERTCTKQRSWRCKECRKDFSTKTNTIMHDSKLDFRTWIWAIYLIITNIKGIASTKMAKDLGVRQATAWHLAMRLRAVYKNSTIRLSEFVEIDETFIGGKESNKHERKKLKSGRGTVGKQAIMGFKQRNGNITGQLIDNTDADTLQDAIISTVQPGSTIITDEHKGYWGIAGKGYTHRVVNHSRKEYVKGEIHTNGIESFWALFKRGYYGIFHSMSPKHLSRYVCEFAGRQNSKDLLTIDQMKELANAINGVMLPYATLIE